MPKALQLFFFVAGLFLILVDTSRVSIFRRALKRLAGDSLRFKLSTPQRIESNLYKVGWAICWAVSIPDWWLRAFFAGLALAFVATLLYRNNLKVPDTPPHDAASVLHVKEAEAGPAHVRN